MSKYCFPAYIEVSPGRFRERFGLSAEQFQQGQVFKHRPGYTFTQQDNINECLDTLNQAMLHFDTCYAEKTEFKNNLMVTTAIIQRLIGMNWKTFYHRKRILKWRRVDMLQPVFANDTLYSESEILDTQMSSPDPECQRILVLGRAINQHGEKTCEMEYEALIYKHESAPFDKLNY